MPPFDFGPRRPLTRLGWRLFPGVCVLCDETSDLPLDLCRCCLDDLPWNGQGCRICALPLPRPDLDVCAACLARPPPFSRTVSALRYEGDTIGLVHALKFERSRVHGRVLATLLAGAVRAAYADAPLPTLVLPVPLSTRRLLRRGQNQAGVLARHLATETGIPVDWNRCRRVRHTAPQTGKSRRQRLRNLAGAFDFEGSLAGETVALIDDVMTTGTTARAVARCLLGHGAAAVHVWTAARTARR